jgi:hypothetical protein
VDRAEVKQALLAGGLEQESQRRPFVEVDVGQADQAVAARAERLGDDDDGAFAVLLHLDVGVAVGAVAAGDAQALAIDVVLGLGHDSPPLSSAHSVSAAQTSPSR